MDRGRSRSQGQPRQSRERDFYDEDEQEYEVPVRRRSAQGPVRPRQPQSPVRTHQPQGPSRPRQPQAHQHSRPRHRVWPILLAGCGLGIFTTVFAAGVVVFLAWRAGQGAGMGGLPVLGNTQTFNQEKTQSISLSTVSQIQICDKIGNVTIKVDPQATTPTVTTQKTVHMASQSAADQEFKRIAVEVQPPGTVINSLTCVKPPVTPTSPASPSTATVPGGAANALTVNVTFPDPDSSGFLRSTSDSVDIAITLPRSALPNMGPDMLVNIEAPIGNITVDGLSGLLNIRGSNGNVNVSHAVLLDGSHIETGQGNVTFNGLLVIPPGQQSSARYMISSEQGTIDVTLPASTNVTLDANTNVGNIRSEFDTPIQGGGSNGANYHGVLSTAASATTSSTVILFVDVSSGNVNIHKAQG